MQGFYNSRNREEKYMLDIFNLLKSTELWYAQYSLSNVMSHHVINSNRMLSCLDVWYFAYKYLVVVGVPFLRGIGQSFR